VSSEEVKKHLELFLLPQDKPAFLGIAGKKTTNGKALKK
jgi:hypothetical protein